MDTKIFRLFILSVVALNCGSSKEVVSPKYKSSHKHWDVYFIYYDFWNHSNWMLKRKYYSDTSYVDLKDYNSNEEMQISDYEFYTTINNIKYKRNGERLDRDFNISDFEANKGFVRYNHNDSVIFTYTPAQKIKINKTIFLF